MKKLLLNIARFFVLLIAAPLIKYDREWTWKEFYKFLNEDEPWE